MSRSAIAAHCRNCTRVVTCLSSDVIDPNTGEPVIDQSTNEVQQSQTLTGRCEGCGTVAEVTPYTPVPFSGHPIDPRAPRMAAHVGPFGAVPTADALRPQVPTGLTQRGVSTSSGVGAPAPAVLAERQAGPAEGIAPIAPDQTQAVQSQPQTLDQTNAARDQFETPAYAPVQNESVSSEPVQPQE